MNFADVMATNPPRLVILCNKQEQFQWGIVGQIPVLSLIGGLAKAQARLVADEWVPEADYTDKGYPFVLVWDAEAREFQPYLHPAIPSDPLIGMMETIRAMLVTSRLAQQAASQQVVLGPDGKPVRLPGMMG